MSMRESTLRVRSWRRLLPAVAGVLVLGTSLAACGDSDSDSGGTGSSTSASSSGSADKPVRIAMVGYDNKNNYTQWWWVGAQEEAKKLGVKVTLVDGKFDAKAQAAAVQNSITSKKFDAVSILPVDGVSLLPVAKQAGDAGLKVIVGGTLGPIEQTNTLDPVSRRSTASSATRRRSRRRSSPRTSRPRATRTWAPATRATSASCPAQRRSPPTPAVPGHQVGARRRTRTSRSPSPRTAATRARAATSR